MHEPPREPAPEGYAYVTVDEAARLLGQSSSTIRRRLEKGTLEGYQVARPQGVGFAWHVLVELQLPAPEPDVVADDVSLAARPAPDASTALSDASDAGAEDLADSHKDEPSGDLASAPL